MTRFLFSIALTLALVPAMASAGCYAEYKAKRDNPLRLHYGVAEITGPCDKRAAKSELDPRLASDGWTLLTVMAVFDDSGLEKRKDSAGDYFLRY